MSSHSPISIGEAFLDQVSTEPDTVALVDSRQITWTWRQLASFVNQVLQEFDQLCLVPGMHLATWMVNSHTWIAVDLAAQLAGLVHVAIDRRWPQSEALKMAEQTHSHILFVHDPPDDSANRISHLSIKSIASQDHSSSMDFDVAVLRDRRRPKPEHAAQILFTSGTSTHPRGVVLSHNNLLSNARSKLAAAPQYTTDVRMNVLPFAHAYARTCELSTWILSGSQLVLAGDWRRLLQTAAQLRPSLINLVPHLAHELALALEKNSNVLGDRMRLLQVGGASLPNDTWQKLAQFGLPPLQGYGQTETSPVVCSNRSGHQRPGTVGQAVEGVELKLDETGQLWTRGPHVMLGYWNAQKETDQKIVNGWLCTGDLAESMADGYWRIIGRADDVIVLSTGYKVSPSDLTNRLGQDPWIEQLVIVGHGRPYAAALVLPRVTKLPLEFFSDSRLNHKKLTEFFRYKWSIALSDLPRPLLLERIGLFFEPLTTANGGLNFKGSIRRKFVEQELLAKQIDQLYDSAFDG